MPTLEICSILAVATLWFCAALRPATFVTLLFAAAPWVGLFVQYGYQLDIHKIGLLLLPVLFLSCIAQGLRLRVNKIPWPLIALVGYACLLTIWQLWSSEVLAFESVSASPFKETMMASGSLFVLRALSFLAVASICLTPRRRNRCASAYVGSVLVLALFGIAQELAYVFYGNFLTYIMRDGIFGSFHETAGTVDVAGMTLMRVYSFSREPKDLALFCLPAIALLIAQISTSKTGSRRKFASFELLVIMVAGILTFSSAFFIILPFIVLTTLALRLKLRGSISSVRQLRWMWALALVLPLLVAGSHERVSQRFTSWGDLLQESRERPAVAFMADNTPRWFAGFGVGSQTFYLPSYMPEEFSTVIYQVGGTVGVESFFLAVLLDLGLIGAFLLLAAVVCLLKKSGDRASFPFRAAFVATLLAGIALQIDLRNGILWLFAGLLLAAITDRSDSTHGLLAMGRSKGCRFPAIRMPADRTA